MPGGRYSPSSSHLIWLTCSTGDRFRGRAQFDDEGVHAAVAAHRHEQVPRAARGHLPKRPGQLQVNFQTLHVV